MNLEKEILKILEKEKKLVIDELFNKIKGYSSSQIIKAIRKLEEENKVELIERIPVYYSFKNYVLNLNYSLWFYLVLAGIILTYFAIFLIPYIYPFFFIRWITGSFFILFFLGFSLVQALFPKRSELETIERFTLSIGLSIAIIPLIGLLLNYSIWKIKLEPVLFSITIFTLIFAVLALYRKYTIAKKVNYEQ